MISTKPRIILCGKAASGKDYLRKLLESKGFKYGVSYTTRPSRVGEVNGKDYFFLSEKDFKNKIEEGFFHEYVTFNGWFYGTSKDQWYVTDDLFIMTPTGLSHLNEEDRKSSFVIYIDIPTEIRRERLMQRNDNSDSIERRIEADERDFEGFLNYDLHITNHKF